MIKIPVISSVYGKKFVLLDKEDIGLVKNGIWLSKAGQHLYVRLKDKRYLHRLIINAPSNMVVDHINRNTLDNRRKNLHIVTIQENLRNQKRPSNKTGYTGVAIYPGGRYTAQIKVNYRKYHLGIFDTIEEAHKARLKAEKQYYVQTNGGQVQDNKFRVRHRKHL